MSAHAATDTLACRPNPYESAVPRRAADAAGLDGQELSNTRPPPAAPPPPDRQAHSLARPHQP